MSTLICRLLHSVLASVVLVGCASGMQRARSTSSCAAQPDTVVSIAEDDDGREIVVERVGPVNGNCEDIYFTRLRYDAEGVLVRRTDEHHRCGVVEETVTTAHGDLGWTVERARNLDHDERMDVWSVSVPSTAEVQSAALQGPYLACTIPDEAQDAPKLAAAGGPS